MKSVRKDEDQHRNFQEVQLSVKHYYNLLENKILPKPICIPRLVGRLV